jgi:flagellar biosynthesis protein FlhF
MKVKTYKNQSLQEGLEDIKRDLGSDALILSTRSVSERPRFGLFKRQAWEITAVLDEKEKRSNSGNGVPSRQDEAVKNADRDSLKIAAKLPAPAKPALIEASPAPARSLVRPQTVASAAAAVAAAPVRDVRMDDLIDEIGELKKSFRTLSKAIPGKVENTGGLYAELLGQGIDAELADHLITTGSRNKPAPTELRERVRRLLADQLIIEPPAEMHAKSRMVSVFVGPTGVGKTTTIAKIAGHAAIRMKKKVGLISTDIFRIGGQEQLTRFGELLGVPTYGCADISTLKDLVASLDDRDLVLIDTPGSSPSDLARLSKLETVVAAASAKIHLVISATTRSEDITKIVSRFQRFAPHSVIFTKIDETDSKGPLVGDLLRNELAVSYLTNGQRVPEDLLIPGADELARYVLPSEPAI